MKALIVRNLAKGSFPFPTWYSDGLLLFVRK